MNKELKNIHLELSLQDTNRILDALGNLPYAQVFGLIESIRSQAIAQVAAQAPAQQAAPVEPEMTLN